MNKIAVDIGTSFSGSTGLKELTDVGTLVSSITSNAVVLAGIIFLFLLIFGGIGIISGAGSENPEQVAKGKQAVTAAIIGFILVFGAYWIVQLVGRVTGINILGR